VSSYSEDKNIALLKKLVSQWPELDQFITYHPGQGYKNLMKKEQAIELYEALGRQYKILVHRDRDSLTDAEIYSLVNDYASDGIKLWFPEQSDIEAYFCCSEFIANLTGSSIADSQAYIEKVLYRDTAPARDQFNSQRQAHNQELYAQGGSPPNDEVWEQFQARPLRGYKGKYVFKQLKNLIPGNVFSESSVVSCGMHANLAADLRTEIENLIDAG
jgi:hypothetical protein